MKKIILIVVGIIVVTVLGRLGWAYYQVKFGVTSTNETSTTSVSENNTEKVVALNILPRTPYGDLTNYEKDLIQKYLRKYPEFSEGAEYDSPGTAPESHLAVRYYDLKTALFELSGFKNSRLCIYDINTLDQIGKSTDCFISPYVEFNNYIFSVINDNIFYYKKGAVVFGVVPNALLDFKNETYIFTSGAGGEEGGISFDEVTRTLTASVFDSSSMKNGVSTKKIRTVKFVLN